MAAERDENRDGEWVKMQGVGTWVIISKERNSQYVLHGVRGKEEPRGFQRLWAERVGDGVTISSFKLITYVL